MICVYQQQFWFIAIYIQWNPSIADTMGLSLRVQITEAFIFWRLLVYIFSVGVTMHTRAVECYEGVL